MSTIKASNLSVRSLLIDGKRPGDVTEFQLSVAPDQGIDKATIKFLVAGKERYITCELDAVSFVIEGENQ